MPIENSPDPKRLWFVEKTSSAAADVENFVGIEFKKTPDKVKVKGSNRWILLANGLYQRSPQLLAVSLFPHKMNEAFVHDFNTVFTFPPRTTHLEEYHGYGHALIYDINPQIAETTTGDGLDQLDVMRGRYPDRFGLASYPVILRCFDEGLATWIGIETALNSSDNKVRANAAEIKNRFLSAYESRDRTDEYGEFLEDRFRDIEEATNQRRSAKLATDLNFTKIYLRRAAEVIDRTKYVLGYWFVSTVVDELTAKGVSRADAVKAMIKKPPRELLNLQSPDRYSQKIGL